MVTAPASVSANSRKSDPVRPPWKAIGVYTAASVMVMAMIGPTSSRAPLSAASIGFSPSPRWRSTFSTTTIASSTTNPTESTMASSVKRLMVKPNVCTRKMPPINERGMATTGTSDDRREPRKRKIVCTTSLMALRMYAVAS